MMGWHSRPSLYGEERHRWVLVYTHSTPVPSGTHIFDGGTYLGLMSSTSLVVGIYFGTYVEYVIVFTLVYDTGVDALLGFGLVSATRSAN